MKDQILLYILL